MMGMEKTPASTPPVQTGHWCPSCEELTEPVPVYECHTCGTEGVERRCDTCNRFAARRDTDGCETCFGELEEVEVVEDHDGSLIPLAEYDPEGSALAERQRAELEAANAEAQAKREAQIADAVEGATATPWSAVTAGAVILVKDWSGRLDPAFPATVLSVTTAGAGAKAPVQPGSIIATVQHHGIRTEAHAPTDVVYVREGAPGAAMPPAERFTVGEAEHIMGAGLTAVSQGFDRGGEHTGGIPVAEIYGRHSARSGSYTRLAAFTDPEAARAYAAAALTAAEDSRVPDSGSAAPIEEETGFFAEPYPTFGATFGVGPLDFADGGFGVELVVFTSPRSASSTRFTDGAVLRRVAEAALTGAERLEDALGLA